MNTKNILILVMAFGFLAASPVFAQTNNKTGTPTTLEKAINLANANIANRLEVLNNLLIRVNALQKISSDQKNVLIGGIQKIQTQLNALKIKIDSEKSITTVTADSNSVNLISRVAILITPQVNMATTGDRIAIVIQNLNDLGTRLQTRISKLPEGADKTSAQKIYSEFTSKINDAGLQQKAGLSESLGLKPDNGNVAKLNTNNNALKNARNKMKTASADLKAARKDAGDIANLLKKAKTK